MANLQIEIMTPDKVAFKGEIISVTIPGSKGKFQVLVNHAPILSSFDTGVIEIVNLKDEEKYFATGGGTVEVLKNFIRILADSFEAAEDIDLDKAKSELVQTNIVLKDENSTPKQIAEAKAASARAKNKIDLIDKLSSGGILNSN